MQSKLGKFLIVGACLALVAGCRGSDSTVESKTASIMAGTEAMVNGSDSATGDLFGNSVAINGNFAVMGADGDDDTASAAGTAFVFTRTGTTWSQGSKLTASDGAASDIFGSAVGTDGTNVVVGAPVAGTAGAAYAYTPSGTTWTETKLTPSDGAASDMFGSAVAIDGAIAVVGAGNHNTNAGAVYVYSGTTYATETKLTASDSSGTDYYGNAVAINAAGDTIVVGAYGHTTGTGQAYVYTLSGTVWTEEAKLTASDAATGDYFGRGVAISGDSVVVGAYGENSARGAAYVFTRSGTVWTQEAKLIARDAQLTDQFSMGSVAIDSDTIAIGAEMSDDDGTSSGSAYVFTRSGTTWTQESKLTASDAAASDIFGHAVGVSGSTVLVGAPANDTGYGYFYDMASATTSVSFNGTPPFTYGDDITLNYTNTPGYFSDFAAISRMGSTAGYASFEFLKGDINGSKTLDGGGTLYAGQWVGRIYENNSWTIAAETASSFWVYAGISTDKSAYTTGEDVVVTLAGMPGNTHDFVAISTAGSAQNSYVAYAYTNGVHSGNVTVTDFLPPGTYVARAFLDNSWTFVGQTSTTFTVTGDTVTTDASTYDLTDTVTVSFAGLPGTNDWISIAPSGSSTTTVSYSQYTHDADGTGSVQFNNLAAGTYVARAFENNGWNLLGESTAFTVNASVTVTPSVVGNVVTVNFSGLPGNDLDWISIAPNGSSTTTYDYFQYTHDFDGTGSVVFTVAPGTYVARAYLNNSWTMLDESTSFTVTDATTLTVNSGTNVTLGNTIPVTWSGVPGNTHDFVCISTAGSGPGYLSFVYTQGADPGSNTFPANAVPSAGTYEVRYYVNNGWTLLKSTTFTVVDVP